MVRIGLGHRASVGGLVLGFGVASGVAVAQEGEGARGGRSGEALFLAWQGLDEGDRQDCVDWFVAECDRDSGFRSTLERYVLRAHDGDPFDWPEGEALPVFDPKVHCPADVIPRRFVDEEAPRWKREREKLVGSWVARRFVPAYEYDWARGTVVRLRAWDDPERIARNASEGFSPYGDLVEAMVERVLDDGALQAEAAAFGHAYSDREGNAFRTVSLYDAWCSGGVLEMPDVECLGIVHSLDDDWRTWVAPVPTRDQRPLYDHIGEHFSRLRKHRALRTSLARMFLSDDAELPAGYQTAGLRFHGIWELRASDPARLALELPDDRGWSKWLQAESDKVDRQSVMVHKARARQQALADSRAWARRTFEGILTEYGAFEPKVEAPATGNGSGDDGDGDGGGVGGGGGAPRHARTP